MAKKCPRCSYENTAEARFCLQCGAMMEQEAAKGQDPLVGRILQDRYRVVSVLGEGGMGKVYLTEQRMGTTTRKVAIKTLHPEMSGDPQLVARFYRECETVVDLSHPNTIKFYDFGELDDKILYIVMEYIEGESLAHALQRGPMPPPRVDKLLVQIAGSLHEAHQKGVVHRDLKPENVLLTNRGGQTDFVKVLDFGIAKRSEAEEEAHAKLTKQGMVLGTPPYMSPEQFSGQALDPRSDIYSIGVMTYEMLTGRLPFEAKTPWEWATKHLTAQPTPLEAHPIGLQLPEPKKHAIMRALAKDRDERQGSIMEFLQLFTGYQDPQAAWTMATSGGGMVSGPASGPQPRALIGTPAPMSPVPSSHGSGPYAQPPGHGYAPTPYPAPDPMSSGGYEFPTETRRGLGAGRLIAVLVILLFVVGGGVVGTLVWWSSKSSPSAVAEVPERPATGPAANPTPTNPEIPVTPTLPDAGTLSDPIDHGTDPVDPDPPDPVEPDPVEPDPVEPDPIEPEDPRPSTPTVSAAAQARGAAALQRASTLVDQNNLTEAASALAAAQRALGRQDREVRAVRSQLARKASNQIGILLQQGRCPDAQRAVRALRAVGADGPSRAHFGDWCRP
jgi:serine/threonine-protein kinase